MQSYLFGDALAGILRNAEFDFDVYKAEKPEDVVDMSRYLLPYAVLMEVTSFGPRLLDERMKIRDLLRRQNPDCKIVLIVDENAEEKLARRVKQAKRRTDRSVYLRINLRCLSGCGYGYAVKL